MASSTCPDVARVDNTDLCVAEEVISPHGNDLIGEVHPIPPLTIVLVGPRTLLVHTVDGFFIAELSSKRFNVVSHFCV